MSTEKRPIRRSYAGAEFIDNSFADARLRNVDMTGAKIRGAMMTNVDIDGIITGLVVNGIEVEPLIQAEKLRRRPELVTLTFSDAAGARAAWSLVEETWEATLDRALALPEALLSEHVDGEWSLLETLRHLVFATDAWLGRTVIGLPSPYAPVGLPATDMPPSLVAACGLDLAAQPTVAEIVALRRSRLAMVRDVVDALTDHDLGRECDGNSAPGYPGDPRDYTVQRCLTVVIREEWEHHEFAVRDLDELSQTR